MPARIAVLVLNFGGPERYEDVESFLFNLFKDSKVIRLPFNFMQKPFARFVAHLRAPKIIAQYKQTGGPSPLNEWTRKQVKGLQTRLPEYRFYMGFSYMPPFITDVMVEIKKDAPEFVIVLPLYPQYSNTTTGSGFADIQAFLKQQPLPSTFHFIDHWYHNAKYLHALKLRIEQGARHFSEAPHIIFSAHSIPETYLKDGDPYIQHIEETVHLLTRDLNCVSGFNLAYQSKLGPVKWVGPSTADTIRSLGAEAVRRLLVCPISFVSDHIETLYEINVELRHIAKQAGVSEFRCTEGLNDLPPFLDALADVIEQAKMTFKLAT